jgi:hypothetical protein
MVQGLFSSPFWISLVSSGERCFENHADKAQNLMRNIKWPRGSVEEQNRFLGSEQVLDPDLYCIVLNVIPEVRLAFRRATMPLIQLLLEIPFPLSSVFSSSTFIHSSLKFYIFRNPLCLSSYAFFYLIIIPIHSPDLRILRCLNR